MKRNHDCAIAALAMYHGVSYHKVAKLIRYYRQFEENPRIIGTPNNVLKATSKELGKELEYSNGMPETVKNGKKAIIVVKHPYQCVYHALFWDGKRIYESLKDTYRWNTRYALKCIIGTFH